MMKSRNIADEYIYLVNSFLKNQIEINEFQFKFLEKFKNEKRKLSDDLYGVLEEIFGDVESYTTDSVLLNENPKYFIDEKQLREKLNLNKITLEKVED